MKTIILLVVLSTLLTSTLVFAQDPPRGGTRDEYCYIDPHSKSIVCRRYP